MGTITTGRTLDADGDPVAGTGFSVDEDGPLADLLRERDGPLTSHPTQPSWGTLPTPADDGEGMTALSILGPGYDGPPEHYHEVSTEYFEVEHGTVVFDVDGTDHRISAGESFTVPTDTVHSFRCPADGGMAVMRTRIAPAGRIGHVLPTFGGIAHDPDVDVDDTLQRVALAKRLQGDTVFTDPDPRVAKPLIDALAPLARLRGYRGGYAKYSQPAFWERHVEQPDL